MGLPVLRRIWYSRVATVTKIKSSLYLRYNAEACDEWREPSPRLSAWAQGWKPGYLALGCQFQFWCVETQMSGFSFGLVSQLLKNRF